jgi:hypothetical protein
MADAVHQPEPELAGRTHDDQVLGHAGVRDEHASDLLGHRHEPRPAFGGALGMCGQLRHAENLIDRSGQELLAICDVAIQRHR